MSAINIQLKINSTVKFNSSITGVNIKITTGNASTISALEVTTASDTTIKEMFKEVAAFVKREMNQRLLNNLANSSENNHRVNANIETNVTQIIYANSPLPISEKSVGSVMKEGDVFQVIGTAHQSSSTQVVFMCCTVM